MNPPKSEKQLLQSSQHLLDPWALKLQTNHLVTGLCSPSSQSQAVPSGTPRLNISDSAAPQGNERCVLLPPLSPPYVSLACIVCGVVRDKTFLPRRTMGQALCYIFRSVKDIRSGNSPTRLNSSF